VFERISGYATAELAYIIEIERTRAKVGGAGELATVALRGTTIFRREDDGWRIVHRHADPITTPRARASVVQQPNPRGGTSAWTLPLPCAAPVAPPSPQR
jgi:hypothetical protein